ncbi:thermonuclease family protein [Fundicoccus ignavus]|uniref:Micrococcal nuclease n=1 Tax=Fundicoccus ignavus TaxID=2664442 RepID=A0A6I2GBW1_9LACT|nr:thermonuclease family protein [Fundicoccus ignavus]MRI84716.1 micrococcal nuclease [Fundicoccus ignavus]MRJ47870.1 micrococcal nuclease [Fundicoccus ignavus]
MQEKQKKQLKKIVSNGPNGGKNGLFKWLVAIVILLAAGGSVNFTDFFGSDTQNNANTVTSQSGERTSTNEELTAVINDFDGENFDILPKLVKIPVTYERVVDGDTQIVSLNGHNLRVRHLMIDTPESVKEGTSVQPYGKEASNRNDQLFKEANNVYLMLDEGPTTDNYARVLAYLYADDLLIAEQLLLEGLASVRYVNPPNNTLEEAFRAAQKSAQKAELNIWSIEGYVEDNGYFNQVD